MILVAIELENYKQYAGANRIEFPREGIVAITGANGAGKTTLFEAIEWCLYCPRSISQASIPPHEGVGKTVVRLTLEDEHDGKQYTVVRELRGSGTRAEIYAVHEPWQPLVQGTREVTHYVTQKLVGLAHNAFVSTFFTKQRELQMFGDYRPTDRRVEVAKLLGLEAVREAQNLIGEGRSAARTLADARRAEYDRRMTGRDLDLETADAASRVELAERLEQEEDAKLSLANEAATQARTGLDAQRDLQEQDSAFQRSLAEEAALLARARAQFDSATREIARLDQRAADRVQMLEIAVRAPQFEDEVSQHELERSRAEQARRLHETVERSKDVATRVANNVQKLLDRHDADAAGLLPWDWGRCDVSNCVLITEQVVKEISGLDVRSLRSRLETMRLAVLRQSTIDELDQKLTRFHQFRETLQLELRALSIHGEAGLLVEDALRSVKEARTAEQRDRMALAKTRDEIEATRQLIQTLREQQDAALCPTCTRPLNPGEVDQLISAISPRLVEQETLAATLEVALAKAAEAVRAAVETEHNARDMAEKIRTLDRRIEDGHNQIGEMETQRNEAAFTLSRELNQLGIRQAPAPGEVDHLRDTVERAQRIAEIAGAVRELGEQAREAIAAGQEANTRLNELGEVRFDENAMRGAVEGLRAARHAAAQVEQIDVELAHRDAYECDRTNSDAEISRANAVQATLTLKREALGFDPAVLNRAQRLDQEARANVDALRETHSVALQAAREARGVRDRTIEEAVILRQLMEEADEHEREADELTRMYDEFREFDRYVARQVGPLLAESTERMLGHVTSGKFDQVQFDENYGIEIFDGDQPFPMASFSGGERDVVALCARLALSEIVGSAALRPPRFLVLDEVFGSLDSDRRAQLLEMLGGLAHSGYFRQMFIVSHVDDVQQSPVMTEAWRIEDSDGVSRVVKSNAVAA